MVSPTTAIPMAQWAHQHSVKLAMSNSALLGKSAEMILIAHLRRLRRISAQSELAIDLEQLASIQHTTKNVKINKFHSTV